jgi:two-component system LytT family response regulator
MIRLAVIDDEAKARETILNILALSNNELEIVGEAADIASGFELINLTNPDLVLLDINLTDGTGFDLLRKFEKIDFKLIFITAHEEYAIQAIKYSALDYVMKPITAGELLKAVDKAKDLIGKEETQMKLSTFLDNLDKLKKIVLRTAESIHVIEVKHIIRCEADVNYTTFFLENGRQLLVSKTLKEYAEMLVPSGFFRTHQSHLVNLEHVLRFDKGEGGHLVMNDNSIVPVSTRNREALFKAFESL